MSELPGYDYQVLLKRNQHGGIVEDKVRGGVVKRYRSTPDAKLFDAMDGQQEMAFHNISTAYQIRTHGLGARIGKYGDFIGATGPGDIEDGAELLRKYDAWHTACKGAPRHLSPLMALDVIVYGLTLAETDEKHTFLHGTALKNLLACLTVWGDV